MTERHAVACGCSDEDQTAKIKERVESTSWGIVAHLSHATWCHHARPSSLSERDGLNLNQEISSINRCSILRKCSS